MRRRLAATLPFTSNAIIGSFRFVTFSQIEETLDSLGFKELNQRGSHITFAIPTAEEKIVTVPNHGKIDIAPGTYATIIRQMEAATGIDRNELKRSIQRGGR